MAPDAVFDSIEQAKNNAFSKNRPLNYIDFFKSKLLQYATAGAQKSKINKKRAKEQNIDCEQ